MKYLGEMKLEYRPSRLRRVKIDSSASVADFLRAHWPGQINHREMFVALYVDHSLNTVGMSLVSIGDITQTIVPIKVILQEALISNATRIIVAHNHPSGSLRPSEGDKSTTIKLYNAVKMIDMNLIDHIILTEDSYFSFADEGLL